MKDGLFTTSLKYSRAAVDITDESAFVFLATAFLTLAEVVADQIAFNLFGLVCGSIASAYRASISGVLGVAIVGTSALGRGGRYFLSDVTPQFIAAFHTAAILGGVKTFVAGLLAADTAVAVGVFAVVRIVVAVYERIMWSEVLPFGAVVTHDLSFKDFDILHQEVGGCGSL